MDLTATMAALREHRALLDEVIRQLESYKKVCDGETVRLVTVGRRGRKSMSMAERSEVSKRMKAYWAQHRKGA